MRGNRRTDTKPETELRCALHARGLRFRKDFRVSTEKGANTRADIVFPRQRVAVFIDGCFWHGCPEHCRVPARNREYWVAKIGRNRVRDESLTAALEESGWHVLRIWEHVPLGIAADCIEAALSADVTTFTT
jgi:DNA mismatch endonuclease (patch repair protein)